jgi:hypothetical protein
MEDIQAMDEAAIIQRMEGRVGRLTDDEVALVRTLTPADLAESEAGEHLKDLFDLLTTVRDEEAMAEYVYAIAPGWDGTVETLLLGARVTTAFTRSELETFGVTAPAAGTTTGRRVPASARRRGAVRTPAAVG